MYINEEVIMKKVTMYTGDPCSFCEAAKALLKSKNVEIEELDIWKDPAKAKEMLQRTNGARTIPQIFINDKHIGGYDELRLLEKENKLTDFKGIKKESLQTLLLVFGC